jgi:hypothetical protein
MRNPFTSPQHSQTFHRNSSWLSSESDTRPGWITYLLSQSEFILVRFYKWQLTPCSRVFLKKLTVAQLVKKYICRLLWNQKVYYHECSSYRVVFITTLFYQPTTCIHFSWSQPYAFRPFKWPSSALPSSQEAAPGTYPVLAESSSHTYTISYRYILILSEHLHLLSQTIYFLHVSDWSFKNFSSLSCVLHARPISSSLSWSSSSSSVVVQSLKGPWPPHTREIP